MGIGFSSLGGLRSGAWQTEQSCAPPHTSGSEQQHAVLVPELSLCEELKQQHQADRIIAEAEFVTELREFQALLGEPRQRRGIVQVIREAGLGEPNVGAIPEITMPLRIAPLMALIRQIGELPGADRPAAFDLIRRVVTDWGVPMARRAALFAELARQIGKLNADDRLGVFDRIHDAVTVAAFPMALRAEPLVALAWQIGNLRATSRLRAFNRIHDAVTTAAFPMGLRAAPLAMLAGLTGRMRKEDGARIVPGRILAATDALPRQYRAEPLTAVVNAICYLRPEQQWEMLNRVLAVTATLEEQHRVTPLVAIGLQLSGKLTGVQRRGLFNLVLKETAGLTDIQMRAVPYQILAQKIPALSASDRLSAYDSILSAVCRPAMQDRRTVLKTLTHAIPSLAVSERLPVLRQLVGRIDRCKTDALQNDLFQHALTTINRLPGDESMLAAELLGRLRDRIPALPGRHRKAARRRMQEAETLLRMAPDVREHYRDSSWINQLVRTRCHSWPVYIGLLQPNGTEAPRQYMGYGWPNAMEEARQYWAGSVKFEVGKRNVLLERIDAGGATRWYLVGQNGDRLSQYLDRRFRGRLMPDATPPA